MAFWSATVSSNSPEPLDLEKGLTTTPEDIAALKRVREMRRLSFADYLRWLSRYEAPLKSLRRSRKTQEGHEPFEL